MSQSHYASKQISEVRPDDSRVSLIGKVINTGNNFMILDDGSGKIEIESATQIDKNKLVRVFCSIADEKLKADIIQDMEGLDLELLKKVNGLYNRAGV